MNLKSKFLILGLVSKIFAAKFSVVSFEGNCQVNVGGKVYNMVQKDPSVPLYTAEVDAPLQTNYNYVCNGIADVNRVLTENNTHNELIGRSTTIYNMPEFGYPNAEPWTRSIGRTELFDPNFVPIVIVNTNPQFFVTPKMGKKDCDGTFDGITFILKDNVFKFDNVPYTCKNFEEDKFQFEVEKLPNGGIYNRDSLKFIPSSFDPVFFRQILYGDIAHAIGNPAHESVAARVYRSDGVGIGLYVLQENCASESFIKSAFYGDKNTGEIKGYKGGNIYDCTTGADFIVNDPNNLGAFGNIDTSRVDNKFELQDLNNKINELNIMDPNAVAEFDENWLDLDTLFRALALEYLAGHWDSYWFLTSNYVVFHPPEETVGTQFNYSKLKHYFVDQDFDQTWGSNMKPTLDPTTYPTRSYTEFIGKDQAYWKGINSDEEYETGNRLLLNKFIGCDGQPTCTTKEYFENHLKSIVQHIFNPVAIKRKTDGYKGRLSEEIKWDYNLKRLHVNPNHQYVFTYEDFERGIEGPTNKFTYGILDWTDAIANGICEKFGIKYDTVPYDPITAAQANVQPIDAGSTYDDKANLNGSRSNSANNVSIMTIAVVVVASLSILFF